MSHSSDYVSHPLSRFEQEVIHYPLNCTPMAIRLSARFLGAIVVTVYSQHNAIDPSKPVNVLLESDMAALVLRSIAMGLPNLSCNGSKSSVTERRQKICL